MDIGFYIADLLKRHDEVSLPGLGTFTRSRIPGFYDQYSNSFYPPSFQVSFDNNDLDRDSVTGYISEQKKLSQPSSEYFVKKFTTSIFELLQTSGIAEIKPIGILRQKDQQLVFESSGSFDIGGKFYGLKPVREIERTINSPVQETPVHESNFFNEFVRDPEPEIEEQAEQQQPDLVEDNAPVSRVKLFVIAGILFLIVMAGLFYMLSPTVQRSVNSFFSQQEVLPQAQLEDNLVKSLDLVLPDSTFIAEQEAKKDSVVKDSLPMSAISPIIEDNTITYEIIGASFGRKADAEKYVDQLIKKGIPAKIVGNIPGNRVKVSIKSFKDEASAQEELNKVLESNKEAWIYTNKPKKTQ